MAVYENFTDNTESGRAQLAQALLAANSGLAIDPSSIQLSYGSYNDETSIAYYDGSLTPLGIDAGILLTSGDGTPPETNTSSSYGVGLSMVSGNDEDPDFTQIAQAAFSGSGTSHDTNWIMFDFTVTDPYNTKGITFDLVFGSDEYPEYSDSSFVDIAGVFLNGQNVALFNASATNPLSVTQANIDLGYFRNNASGVLPVEYDGVSNKLTIYAPLQPGVNTLKIGVADTGDHVYDSGLYVANLKGTLFGGGGLSNVVYGTDGDDNIVGTENSETFDLGPGNDTNNPGAGDDVVLGGSGNDTVNGGSGHNQIDGGEGNDTVVYTYAIELAYVKIMDNGTIKVGNVHTDTLLNMESLVFSNGTHDAHQLIIEDHVAKIYVAYFGRAADAAGLDWWVSDVNHYLGLGQSMNDSLKNVIDSFAHSAEAEALYPGMNSGDLDEAGLTNFITSVYQNLFDRDPDQAGLEWWLNDATALQEAGVAVGTIIKTIIDGALDTLTSLDRTLIQNKAQVAWNYANQYDLHDGAWDTSLGDEAKAFIDTITTDHSTVNNAYIQILGIFEPGVMPVG